MPGKRGELVEVTLIMNDCLESDSILLKLRHSVLDHNVDSASYFNSCLIITLLLYSAP